ncbi:IS1182 family transposase [Albimonas sp. CAU 1670]|uniref:IS1182 family transposase n=1 Tax=Albimonas sp. CAU 1670 TaxID=3032599 RepID=UPI0023D99788|nr:IS1182 family transposase [Albimonas sp. CAU 1670]MDF2235520.1 IS1182 family transposase [Albimonas sp. CAU 1670]
MMGERQVLQASLFYEFRLEDQIPADHLIRAIDRFVDLSDLRRQLAPFYSSTGRPSIDPELMIRMLLVGYCFGIRSERRLCEEVRLNLAFRWFCRLDLTDAVPDHSTFSKNRHGRFRDSDLFRRLFETVLARCIAEGLVGGEVFGVDASLIKADANREDGIEPSRWAPDDHAGRATSEYLATLDDAAFGAATDVPPKYVSPVDPAARWSAADRGKAHFLYAANDLVDLDNAVIVDVEATAPIRQAENRAARDMIERTMDRFDLYPERLVADTGYGSAETLAWLVHEHGIEPHIPVVDKSRRRDGIFSREDFAYDLREDAYRCPAGNWLRQYRRPFSAPRSGVDEDGMMRYRARKADCDACALKPRCAPKVPVRKILRSIHEGARDLARHIAETDAYAASMRQRKKVEMLFTHLKRILKLDRLRLRGPNGARDEFHLAATAQNLRKLAKLVPAPG